MPRWHPSILRRELPRPAASATVRRLAKIRDRQLFGRAYLGHDPFLEPRPWLEQWQLFESIDQRPLRISQLAALGAGPQVIPAFLMRARLLARHRDHPR